MPGPALPLLTDGEMGRLVHAFDWSTTPLGPLGTWPISLRTAVGILLHSEHPMFLWWGPELVQIYNDAFRPSLGVGKHPAALGQRGRDCWQEIWPIIGPQIDDVMARGKASWQQDAVVPILRNGRLEEVYWTYGYSPVFDDRGAIGGTLVVCTETTRRVLAERRSRILQEVTEGTAQITEPADLVPRAAELLAAHARDLPFVMFLELDAGSGRVLHRHASPLDERTAGAIEAVVRSRIGAAPHAAICARLPSDVHLPPGAWPEPTTEIFIAPIVAAARDVTTLAVFGVSPRLAFDDAYRDFLAQICEHLANAGVRVESRRSRAAIDAEREVLLAELRAANRTKDEFLAMLGHELRNPLSPIVTALELMNVPGADHAASMRLIERQVQYVVHLVDDLLDVSRITRGQLELTRAPIELSIVIARALETASTPIETGRHTLAVDVPARGLVVDGDAMRLAQVLANLLTNAAKYTPPGGHIWVSAARDGDAAVIRVRDDGVGIAPQIHDSIFGLFNQVQQDLARSQGGLGLGLAIARTLTERHGGTIAVHSAGRGHGSEFVVRLPLIEAPRLPAPAPPIAPRAGPPRRILIVDDNEDAATILAEALSSLGHDVRFAHNGPTALRLAREHVPDVALLDIGLPVMDGYELAMHLRAEPRTAAIYLIALTGYAQAGDRERTHRAGFAEHLVKPVSINVLVAAIARAT